MRCGVCGAEMTAMKTDLPFKVREAGIVILKGSRSSSAETVLPAEATVEDAIETLIFLAKIERGLAELDAGRGIDHSEVKRRLRVQGS